MKVLVSGASGFLGQHMEYRLKRDGHFVVSIGRSYPKYRKSIADEFDIVDLSQPADSRYHYLRHEFDYEYQFSNEVGGISYISDGNTDAAVLTNSVRINLNTLEAIRKTQAVGKILFVSSQCVYPDRQPGLDPFAQERIVSELDLLPHAFREQDASFDNFAFGQANLFVEKLYDAYRRNHGIKTAIARLGNTYGPYCTWDGPRAKAPAAICRKVAQAPYAGVVDLFGDGQQQRSFTYVDDAIDGLIKLMEADHAGPVNIAHSEQVTVAELFETICRVAGKVIAWRPSGGPVGVSSRGSDNTLCRQVLGWEPATSLWYGMGITYPWVRDQATEKANANNNAK